MRNVPEGTRGSHSKTVTHDDLASTLDSTLPAVMATRVMVGMMELAAMDAIKPFLEPGESSVGVSIEVQHTAATPPGQKVQAFAEVTRCEGRRLEFKVSARDENEDVGSGTHRRAVIDFAKFNERLKSKVKS